MTQTAADKDGCGRPKEVTAKDVEHRWLYEGLNGRPKETWTSEDIAKMIVLVAKLETWLMELEPSLDALICYASSIEEHPLNGTVHEIREYFGPRAMTQAAKDG